VKQGGWESDDGGAMQVAAAARSSQPRGCSARYRRCCGATGRCMMICDERKQKRRGSVGQVREEGDRRDLRSSTRGGRRVERAPPIRVKREKREGGVGGAREESVAAGVWLRCDARVWACVVAGSGWVAEPGPMG
jgi:hypothetical protein